MLRKILMRWRPSAFRYSFICGPELDRAEVTEQADAPPPAAPEIPDRAPMPGLLAV
jgi:hypothetical protein